MPILDVVDALKSNNHNLRQALLLYYHRDGIGLGQSARGNADVYASIQDFYAGIEDGTVQPLWRADSIRVVAPNILANDNRVHLIVRSETVRDQPTTPAVTSPTLSPPSNTATIPSLEPHWIYRLMVVTALLKLLFAKHVVLVRGTPGSGKTTLARLLHYHIWKIFPEYKVIYCDTWLDSSRCLKGKARLVELAQEAGVENVTQAWFTYQYKESSKLIFLIDEGQFTYSDIGFWNVLKQEIQRGELGQGGGGAYFVVFSSNGSPSTFPDEVNANIGTPICIHPEQQVSLTLRSDIYSGNKPWGLLFNPEEVIEAIEKFCKHCTNGLRLANDLKDTLMDLTSGHIGAILGFLIALKEQPEARAKLPTRGVLTNIDLVDLFSDNKRLLSMFMQFTAFARGLPTRRQLEEPVIAQVLSDAIPTGYIDYDDALTKYQALARVFRHGWMQADLGRNQARRYYFASRVHMLAVEGMLAQLNTDSFPSEFRDLRSFVIRVLKTMSKSAMRSFSQSEGGPGEHRRPREAWHHCEFFRAMTKVLRRAGFVVSEWTGWTKKGRVDLYLPARGWAIELLADFDRLTEHIERFEPNGMYSHWIARNEVKDYIVINMTHFSKFNTMQRTAARPASSKLLHAAFRDESYNDCMVYDNHLRQLPGANGHFALLN
ncbi:hypothetical protein BJ508DRAFT_321561 [Ascobolus immersus RN42]|uniref:Novel STAND NTPase 3 domain-containing protein n=1 Tax=Ascobolus immersus RN42 TaxID=1160509 RepID=A0A3N4IJT6_ASCIM|nr:hypothetical protein BJ508DRAFT_321561 [Ascobolus immersus RN42]